MTRRSLSAALVFIAAACPELVEGLASSTGSGQAAAIPVVDYGRDIKTLFKERCVTCHGAVKQKGKLRLDAGALILKGGENRVVEPGDGRHSDLLMRIISDDKDERMPPEGKRLSADERNPRWCGSGSTPGRRIPADEKIAKAPTREHWAFQPVRPPPVPTVRDQALGAESDRCVRAGEAGVTRIEAATGREADGAPAPHLS